MRWASGLTLFSCLCCSFATIEGSSFASNDTDVDVIIVGGGSAGTYAATQLRDFNKSVAVIERKIVLGGHAETYKDPATNFDLNLGVVLFANSSTVRDYFARYDVALTKFAGGTNSSPPIYFDFQASKVSHDFSPPSGEAFVSALLQYRKQLEKFPSIQNGFDLQYPVSPELLLSFDEFIGRYNLSDIAFTTYSYNQGFVPLLKTQMLYMFKYLNQLQVNSFLTSYLTTASGNTHEIYDKAAAELGSSVLYGSSIVNMSRSAESRVSVVVQANGGLRRIKAKKILSTVPPIIENLHGFDLSANETNLFSQFSSNGYYSAVLNNTGINTSITNVDTGRKYGIPQLPGLYAFQPTADPNGLVQVFYASPAPLSADTVKQNILADLAKLPASAVSGRKSGTKPEIVAFTDHSPFNCHVSSEAIQNGFYRDLEALQGKRNTWYAGAAWQTQDSSVIWQNIKQKVLPGLIQGL